MINLLYCGNDKAFDGMIISLLSIIKYNSEPLKVYVLSVDLSNFNENFKPITEKHIQVLNSIVKNVNEESNVSLILLDQFKQELLNSQNVNTSYSPYCFLRLFADELNLPDKILYLDTDTVACKNIDELYNKDITDYEYAGVLDYYGSKFIKHNYINSGVLLLNLKLIKKTNLFKKCRALCYEKELFLPDQNALNRYTTKKMILNSKYNSQKRLKPDTVIRHFAKTIIWFPYFHTLNIKPWNIELLHNRYKCFEFDEILNVYTKIKNDFNEEKK